MQMLWKILSSTLNVRFQNKKKKSLISKEFVWRTKKRTRSKICKIDLSFCSDIKFCWAGSDRRSCIGTKGSSPHAFFNVRLLHAVAFSKKLLRLAQTIEIYLKTQTHAVNARWKRVSQLDFNVWFSSAWFGAWLME